MSYASGRHAYGYCDRCGARTPLNNLKEQIIDRNLSGLLVCDDCLDIDHEQLRLGEVRTDDAIALERPRPDLTIEEGRALTAWNPVGSNLPLLQTRVGIFKVEVS